MDNAVNALNTLFTKNTVPKDSVGEQDTTVDASAPTTSAPTTTDRDVETVDSEVQPAVEHTHVRKEHETREQKVVEKEKHQDHYHTTIQPLKDNEVQAEKHDYTQQEEHRNINRDDGTAKAQAARDLAGLEDKRDEEQIEIETKEKTKVNEHVHHHLHETIQPVIEKGMFEKSKCRQKKKCANAINRGR